MDEKATIVVYCILYVIYYDVVTCARWFLDINRLTEHFITVVLFWRQKSSTTVLVDDTIFRLPLHVMELRSNIIAERRVFNYRGCYPSVELGVIMQ